MEFVDTNPAGDLLYGSPYDPIRWEYNQEFVGLAARKGIIKGPAVGKIIANFALGKYLFVEQVYACDAEKLNDFLSKYRSYNNGWNLPYSINDSVYSEYKLSIDCEKAKTVPLEPEKNYFAKYMLKPYLVICFIYLPLFILLLWTALRFVIISPILWIFKKKMNLQIH